MSEIDQLTKVGVWRAIGEFKIKEAMWPEGLLAAVVGAGGAAVVITATDLEERMVATTDVLALAGALLAVVFTALAIVVSLPSVRYLRMLGETPGGGMRRFLDPFLVAVGTQIAIILLAVSYRLVATDLRPWVEHLAFCLIGFLFVFGIFDVAALARQLVRHGVLRAMDAADSGDERPDELPRLSDRRG